MRTWRVGTVSMGLALLGLGIILLLSKILSIHATSILLSWWPSLFIILGCEILVYLYWTRKEKPYLKYDFLSIIFIGILGTTGIGLMLLSSTGILGQVEAAIQGEEKIVNLPGFQEKVDQDIKRIVVNGENYPLTIENSTNKQVTIFGTYRTVITPEHEFLLNESDYLLVKESGDTLYITFKSIPTQHGLFGESSIQKATLLIPEDVALEVNNSYQDTILKPRQLQQNWNVTSAEYITVYLPKTSDIMVQAFDVDELQAVAYNWKTTKRETTDEVDDSIVKQDGTLKTGKGTYALTISKASSVNVIQGN